MTKKTNSFEKFWNELKRRKVVHVITVYAAVAFVILQLVDIIGPSLKWPEWTMTFIIVLLCIGFIISVFVSWVYDITPAGVKKTKPVSTVKQTDHTITPTSSEWKIATYVSGVIIIALLAFNFISRRNLNADISKLEKSIAVLPFINDSPSDSNQYFINGIQDEILNNLQTIKDFRVLSRTSTDQYKSTSRPTIPEISERLGVNFIVEGSGQKYGNFYRLRVQLIAGKNERHLWAQSFEKEIRETKDIFSVQSEIAQAIADELEAIITPEEKHLIEKTPTSNLTALDFFERGRAEEEKYSLNNPYTAFHKLFNNVQAIQTIEKLYRSALRYDSTFAQAYTGLAWVYWSKHYYDEYFSNNFLDSVMILANIGLSFDSQLAEAYYVKGRYYQYKGFTQKAIAEFDKTIKLNPNDWKAYYGKGELYSNYDLVKSIDNFNKSISLNRGEQLPGLLRDLGWAFIYAGFPEKFKFYFQEALKLDGDSTSFYYNLSYNEAYTGNINKTLELDKKVYSMDTTNLVMLYEIGVDNIYLGNYKEALYFLKKWYEKSDSLSEVVLTGMHRLGLAYWENGYKKEGEYFFDKQIYYCNRMNEMGRVLGDPFRTFYDLAAVYAFRGQKEKAYENLRIFNKRQMTTFWWVSHIKTDPLFNGMRNEPEFQQIVKDVEAKYQAEHERVRKWLEEQGIL